MYFYNEDDYYCDPSEEEIFFDDMRDKFKEMLKTEIKTKIENLEKENSELRTSLKEYKDKEVQLKRKEDALQYEKENLKLEVEREFYNKTIIEVFNDLLEKSEVWYAETVTYMQPKCELCDEDRNMVTTFPDGSIAKKPCSCSSSKYKFAPVISENREIKFYKSYKQSYPSYRKCYFKKYYQPNKNSAEAYDCYGEFIIENVYDDFTDEVKEYHKSKRYAERIAFTNREACQKYCDWLNKKN